jgi:hypothetical protein
LELALGVVCRWVLSRTVVGCIYTFLSLGIVISISY